MIFIFFSNSIFSVSLLLLLFLSFYIFKIISCCHSTIFSLGLEYSIFPFFFFFLTLLVNITLLLFLTVLFSFVFACC